MPTYKTERDHKPIIISALIAFAIFIILITFLLMFRNSLKNNETLDVTQRYMNFESKVERLIYSRVNLLRGFIAYTQTTENIDDTTTYEYLTHLFAEDPEYIRNIGILKDTTLIWNYPKIDINALTIGVDFATIENQKELVLKVKNELTPVMQGPITLFQGGTGFLIRLPIRDRYSAEYLGQLSAVLKTDKILGELHTYSERLNLNIEIYNAENPETPFFSNCKEMGEFVVFNIDSDFINWRVHVDLSGGLADNSVFFTTLTIAAAVFALTIGILVYKYLKSNAKILEISMKDHLTGLYNRHFLEDYQFIALSSAMREGHKMALIMIDLNRFKAVNDTYGHAVGDKVLMETARIMQKFTRANEVIFRLGGDEFLIILPTISEDEDLDLIKNRLAATFAHEFYIPNYDIDIKFGLGYSVFPEDGEDFDTLLRVADDRMYEDKHQ